MNTNKQSLPFLISQSRPQTNKPKNLVIFFNISFQFHKKQRGCTIMYVYCLLCINPPIIALLASTQITIPLVTIVAVLLLRSSMSKHGHNHYGFMISAYCTKTGTDTIATIYIQSIVIALSVPKRVCTHLIAKYIPLAICSNCYCKGSLRSF